MKFETLKDRIAKAEERLTKKQNTITKKTALIAKKQAGLSKANADERYWIECDIEHLQDDIERLEKEIEATKEQIENYNSQLAGAEKEENTLKELPEILKGLRDELVTRWDAYDKDHAEFLKKRYAELGYKAFVKEYHYSAYDEMHRSSEEIHKANTDAARSLILDLVRRISDRVGEITDWSGIAANAGTHGFTVLNGYVAGAQGRVRVESIGAGGYNIQRYHIRVLVHEIN